MKTGYGWLIVLLLALGLATGCARSSVAEKSGAPEEDTIGRGVIGISYSDMGIGYFAVDDDWSGSVNPYGISGRAGNVALPREWRPGIRVKVDWRTDAMWEKDPDSLRTEYIEVPPYDSDAGGYLFVAFDKGGKVRVGATGVLFNHPDALKDFPPPDLICEKDPECKAWLAQPALDRKPREGHY